MSDIARPYPNGQELAKGNQTGGMQYPNGSELASAKNKDLAHDYKDDRTR